MKTSTGTRSVRRGQYSKTILEIKVILGIQAQNRVKQALINLTKKNLITGYYKSKWLSADDKKGIDFSICLLTGKEVLVQVKTHFEHREKEKYLKKEIHPIEVGRKQIKEIEEEILWLVENEDKEEKKHKFVKRFQE